MPIANVNGINLYYEQSGMGPDLVFVSGLACDHTMWDINKFKDRFRVLTIDNRGIGQSDVPDKFYNMQAFTEDVIALCNHLDIQKAHFVGHSMGGHIVQSIAAYHPNKVDKLVIACSEQEISVISYLATKLQIELLQYNLPKRLLIESILPFLLSSEFLEKTNRTENFIQENLNNPHPQSPKGYIGQVDALRTHNTKAFLDKIKASTLIIGCENDLLTPLKNSEYLHTHIKNSILKVINSCGHVPFKEKPDEFLGMIFDYLIE